MNKEELLNCCGTARSFVEVTKNLQFENFVKIFDCLNIKKKKLHYTLKKKSHLHIPFNISAKSDLFRVPSGAHQYPGTIKFYSAS